MPLQHVSAGDHRLLQDVADCLAASRKVVMVTGAGISTSCGIPDFRSKDGLYSLIQQQRATRPKTVSQPPTPSKKRKFSDLDDDPTSSQESISSTSSISPTPAAGIKGKDLFDARVWKDPVSTATFYTFIASLRKQIHEEVKQTSQTHKFIRVLRDGGRLMRCYTQNIDGLEQRESLSSDLSGGTGNKRRFMKKVWTSPRPSHIDKDSDHYGGCEVVPLHGDLNKLRCTLCQGLTDWTEADSELFLEGEAPHCQSCSSKAQSRKDRGKRGLSIGLLRPNIVLYQEQHPSEHLLAPLPLFDMANGPDLLIVTGTSLQVRGVQNLVRQFAKSVHASPKSGRVVFVNRTKPSESIWDSFIDDWVEMDCDDWVMDLKSRREDLWLQQGELDLKATKPNAGRSRKKSEVVQTQSTPPSNSTGTVAVVIESSSLNSALITQAPPKKRRRKSKTPDSVQQTGLPTPPSSHGKRKQGDNRALHKEKSHTPWITDSSLTPTTARQKQIQVEVTAGPDYSPIKPLTAEHPVTQTPWLLQEGSHNFQIYNDDQTVATEARNTPTKDRGTGAIASNILRSLDQNIPLPMPIVSDTDGKSTRSSSSSKRDHDVKETDTATSPRTRISINELLN